MFENPFSPGQTSGMGKDGVAGNKGKQGASLYFINYHTQKLIYFRKKLWFYNQGGII